jgi:hypothetical protein
MNITPDRLYHSGDARLDKLRLVHGIRMLDCDNGADTRLATYGTLAPGRVNHHQLAALNGHWQRGTVQGRLIDGGWGAAHGFPGLILDTSGPLVEVYLFESFDCLITGLAWTSSKALAIGVL